MGTIVVSNNKYMSKFRFFYFFWIVIVVMCTSETGHAVIKAGKTDQFLRAVADPIKQVNEVNRDTIKKVALSIPGIIDAHEKIKRVAVNLTRLGNLMQVTYFVYQIVTASPRQKEIKQSIGFFKSVCAFGKGLVTSAAWLNFFSATGKMGLQMGGQVVLHTLVESSLKKVSHDDTLSWYKDKQTTFNTLEQELLSDVVALGQQDIDNRERAYRKSSFVDLAQSLVYQMEKIAGYIEYKGLQNRALYQEPAGRAVNYLIEETNLFVYACNQALVSLPASASSAIINTTKLTKIIEDFYKKSRKTIHDFARLDREDEVHAIALQALRNSKKIEENRA